MKANRIWGALALLWLLALIVLCVAWEMWLAPLRPHGSLFVLKALPLLLAVRGVWRMHSYTMQWLSMLVLLYFTEGVVSAAGASTRTQILGGVEIVLSVALFVNLLMILGPQKKAARRNLKSST